MLLYLLQIVVVKQDVNILKEVIFLFMLRAAIIMWSGFLFNIAIKSNINTMEETGRCQNMVLPCTTFSLKRENMRC